jgi:hypothetical protein
LPVNCTVSLDVDVEGVRFEAAGVVRTSYPLVGMGISFQDLTPDTTARLSVLLAKAKGETSAEQPWACPTNPSIGSPSPFPAEDNPAPLLVTACRKLSQEFDRWKRHHSPAEVEELRQAVNQLQQKLAPLPESELIEFLLSPVQKGGTA